MRKKIIYLLVAVIGLVTTPVRAADPCEVVLCMYGKLTGANGGGSCNSPEKAFFDINVFKKGIFQPTKTSNLRKSFLGECPTADPKDIAAIISKFGRIRG